MSEKQSCDDLVFRALSRTESLDLPSAIDGFLLSLELENRTPATLAYNRRLLKNFLWFAKQQSDWPATFADINKGHIERFIFYLRNTQVRWGKPKHTRSSQPVKASTIQHYHAVLHALWNWALRDELVPYNPVDRIRSPKVEQRIIEPLTETEIRKLLEVCKSGRSENKRRDLAIVLLMLDTGLRASELCGLKLSNWDQKRVKVFGKGRKERWLALSPYTAKAIWDYVTKERGESFYEELCLLKTGEPLSVDSVETMLMRRSKEAGIRHVWPHLMRHTFAVTWCEAGGPLNALQSLLGHERPDMSMRYAEIGSERAGKHHKEFSPVERLNLRFREKKG